MSDVLPLKKNIIYGPVRSRRLGRSLGINLLPPGRKWCTFDCLYCQYGWTPRGDDRHAEEKDVPSHDDVVRAVEIAIRELDEPPAYLTFSGNGEPTLHPDFPRIADVVNLLRDRIAPRAKTALLSNSSRVGDRVIRAAIARLDRPIMKLDAGNARVFRDYNRPVAGIAHDDIVGGLSKMRNITLQALFTAGPQGNLEEENVFDWIEKVKLIRPRDVQIYTISRPIPSQGTSLRGGSGPPGKTRGPGRRRTIAPAPASALMDIRDRLCREGIPAEVF